MTISLFLSVSTARMSSLQSSPTYQLPPSILSFLPSPIFFSHSLFTLLLHSLFLPFSLLLTPSLCFSLLLSLSLSLSLCVCVCVCVCFCLSLLLLTKFYELPILLFLNNSLHAVHFSFHNISSTPLIILSPLRCLFDYFLVFCLVPVRLVGLLLFPIVWPVILPHPVLQKPLILSQKYGPLGVVRMA